MYNNLRRHKIGHNMKIKQIWIYHHYIGIQCQIIDRIETIPPLELAVCTTSKIGENHFNHGMQYAAPIS
jgi:hypothetical protein